jgi:hypothetical protein
VESGASGIAIGLAASSRALERRKVAALDQAGQSFRGKRLALGYLKGFTHILPAHTKPPSVNASDDLEAGLASRAALVAYLGQVLNARHLVSGRITFDHLSPILHQVIDEFSPSVL